MPMPVPALTWTSLTDAVNLRKRPGLFITQLLGLGAETLPTETVEIWNVRGERDVAPFVRTNAEAVQVGGLGEELYEVQAPNIAIKRPFRPSELLFGRKVNSVVYPTGDQVISAVEAHIARDLEYMDDLIVNAEEWMAAQALRGSISYSQSDREKFTIAFNRASGNSITPSVYWDDATPANIRAIDNIRAVQLVVSEAVGLGVTDAIMGSEVAPYFRKLPELLASINTQSGFKAGSVDLTGRYRNDGAILEGVWMGINWWSYPRTLRIEGTATALIRSKYVEFVAADPQARWTRYYGAIPDMDALEGRVMQSRRFSKSWKIPDPSAMMALIKSRPLVVPLKPDSTVSFKAISG